LGVSCFKKAYSLRPLLFKLSFLPLEICFALGELLCLLIQHQLNISELSHNLVIQFYTLLGLVAHSTVLEKSFNWFLETFYSGKHLKGVQRYRFFINTQFLCNFFVERYKYLFNVDLVLGQLFQTGFDHGNAELRLYCVA
jgi:hypothetical protein